MRSSVYLGCLLSLVFVALVGCGKTQNTPAAGAAAVQVLDASKFRPAFESAPAETQTQVNQIMLAIGSSDYVGALTQLEALTNSPGITPQQLSVTANLSQQLQKKLADTPPSQ